ncbi:MAG: hypothetical protein ACYC6A_14455 [Armatimonadota bacterium]
MHIQRLGDNPIITPHMDDGMGANINGPSLICVPAWLPSPLGRYYLYFAAHNGTYIRLAYADELTGPWTTYAPGTLRLEQTVSRKHIASPDMHVDEERRQIRMYFHGPGEGGQFTHLAVSSDGLNFTALPEVLGLSYFRVFRWGEHWYALGMPGIFYRSRDGVTGFEQGPTLFTPDMRHSAVLVEGQTLHVWYTIAGDCPERILYSTVDLAPDWTAWQATPPRVALEPEREYEGADLPLEPSVRGQIHVRARQLRDPAVFRQGEQTYLLYAVAGESGIAIADMGFSPTING